MYQKLDICLVGIITDIVKLAVSTQFVAYSFI